MTVLFFITRLITLPGAYLRAFLEHIVCKARKLIVETKTYIRLDEACGHVEHEFPKSRASALLISLLPGTITFIFGVIFTVSGLLPLTLLKIRPGDSVPMFAVYVVLLWLGASFLCNIFPLYEDALNSRELLNDGGKAAKIIFTVPCAVSSVGAFLEKNCITVLTTAAIIVCAFLFL